MLTFTVNTESYIFSYSPVCRHIHINFSKAEVTHVLVYKCITDYETIRDNRGVFHSARVNREGEKNKIKLNVLYFF